MTWRRHRPEERFDPIAGVAVRLMVEAPEHGGAAAVLGDLQERPAHVYRPGDEGAPDARHGEGRVELKPNSAVSITLDFARVFEAARHRVIRVREPSDERGPAADDKTSP